MKARMDPPHLTELHCTLIRCSRKPSLISEAPIMPAHKENNDAANDDRSNKTTVIKG